MLIRFLVVDMTGWVTLAMFVVYQKCITCVKHQISFCTKVVYVSITMGLKSAGDIANAGVCA